MVWTTRAASGRPFDPTHGNRARKPLHHPDWCLWALHKRCIRACTREERSVWGVPRAIGPEDAGSSMETTVTQSSPLTPTVLPVVGLGASAGGLEVLQQLLAALPADT